MIDERGDLAIGKDAFEAVADFHLDLPVSWRTRHEQDKQPVRAFLSVAQAPLAEEIRRELLLGPVPEIRNGADRDLSDPRVVEPRCGGDDLLLRALAEEVRLVDHVAGERGKFLVRNEREDGRRGEQRHGRKSEPHAASVACLPAAGRNGERRQFVRCASVRASRAAASSLGSSMTGT